MGVKKRSLWGILLLALMFVLAACGGGGSKSTGGGSDSAGNESGSSGDGGLKDTYTVASDTSFVPFEFKEKGEYVGFDIDLINAIADEVGFEIKLETTNFDGIIPGLQTGSFDIAIAGITITDERKKTVDFSDPYYDAGLRIGVAVDNDDINSIEDLKGKTVATRLGSTSADYIKENIEGAKASQFEQLDQAYLAVENGSADAILYDSPNVAYYIQTKGKDSLKMVGELYQAEQYGIAFAKGQDELVSKVNEALSTLKENGKYDEIYEKWFGEKPE
ncbi:glutamine ABC transporter substrate-binding protein [Siminovitchia fortis]|uniref:Glutamine ABC transporter substrate-binding protein n=3 Tax=Bacillales TaxID=1385 RepID=A0A443J0N1_9BACI|nr:glutamine ABC transporter substrate-binding protein [Siminovitchia fortis]RWR13960.1 glutamine ABC transporter substrate-binding protein [Siminovitchia fortis]WHY81191.1 glutamine ABC transporter substrate-binding protein [Siminovitchia fortis]